MCTLTRVRKLYAMNTKWISAPDQIANQILLFEIIMINLEC